MFKKPFKTKSNCQIKSSEKKKLAQRVKSELMPNSEMDIEIFSSKETLNMAKVITYSGVIVNVFTHNSIPILFELQNKVYPTVYMLWKHPQMIYSFATHSMVVKKLYDGADLMLPGVVLEKTDEIPPLVEGTPVGVCTTDNIACIAVGQSCISRKYITTGGRSGKAVKILHTYGDELNKLMESVPVLPHLTPILQDRSSTNVLVSLPLDADISTQPEEPSMKPIASGSSQSSTSSENKANFDKLETDIYEDNDENELKSDVHSVSSDDQAIENVALNFESQSSISPNVDELADYCLLKALRSPELKFPILANIFYKNFMLNVVLDGLELNIKKTRHKKLSSMLKFMSDEGIMKIEDCKGVITIVSVNFNHQIFKEFKTKYQAFDMLLVSSCSDDEGPLTLETIDRISEEVIIKSSTAAFFKNSKYRTGDSVPVEAARGFIVSYIKENDLARPSNNCNVALNPALKRILNVKQEVLPWSEVVKSTIEKMSHCYVIHTSKGRMITGKGKLRPIEVSTATRTGNKCVTLVKNLDKYGININEFARHCRTLLAASATSVTNPNSVQFLVQGNHKASICSLLTAEYKIPKKLILGYTEKTRGKKEG